MSSLLDNNKEIKELISSPILSYDNYKARLFNYLVELSPFKICSIKSKQEIKMFIW